MTRLKDLIQKARSRLQQSGIEDFALNVDLLLAKLLRIDRSHLPLHWSDECQPEIEQALMASVGRRCLHEPLQYILEEWSFLDFTVTVRPGALIPRPETEELFLALADMIEQASFKGSFRFADVCTGSGVIGLALARRFPGATGFLTDISSAALAVATENLERQEDSVKNRLELLQADLLNPVAQNSLNVIVANPPYIPGAEISGLMLEVRDFEPHLALDGGPDGLDFIRRLLEQARFCLQDGGLFAFEHGHGQRQNILALLKGFPSFEIILAGDDLCSNERFFLLREKK